jgi:hypothetical protein
MQAVYDLRYLKHRHRNGARVEFRVHTGFWKLYKGIRTQVIDGLEKGLQEHEVDELIVSPRSASSLTSLTTGFRSPGIPWGVR